MAPIDIDPDSAEDIGLDDIPDNPVAPPADLPPEVLAEFNDSLDTDMAAWQAGVGAHAAAFDREAGTTQINDAVKIALTQALAAPEVSRKLRKFGRK